jgi:hypothetical protein
MGGGTGMDIRLPMGLMFSIIGLIIAVYGFATKGDAMYDQHSLGLNVNLCWGSAMLLFGLAMLALSHLASRKSSNDGGRGFPVVPDKH